METQPLPPSAEPASPEGATRFVPAEIGGVSSPLVGREQELQQLIGELYGIIEGGPSRLVTIVGPAGIGKSRLAYELRQVAARLPEPVSLLTIQADRQSTGQPYSLLRRFVAAMFQIKVDAAPETVRLQLEQGVASLLGSDNEEKAHFIGQLAGYDLTASPHLRGLLDEPRQIRDRALHYAAQCMQAFTAQAPMVLILDDFHYADDSSLDAIAHVVDTNPGLELLVLCLAQARLFERRPAWGQQLAQRHSRIDLGPLDERDGRRLVGEILRKAGKLPTELRNLIVSRAEGNPFYVEELIKMLIGDGVIVPGSAAWTVQQGRLLRLRIPATLNELLRARVQSLLPAERVLLLRAAVVGRNFWAEAAVEPGHSLSEAMTLLAGLERKELIASQAESRFPGKREFQFRHELLYEVAYMQVPDDARVKLHRGVAEWLILSAGERVGAYANLVAEHFERGGDTVRAAHWHTRAGDHARETYALDAAIQRYQFAIALQPTLDEQIACYEGLGAVYLATARLGEAAASYQQMADLAAGAGEWTVAARALNGLAYVQDHALEYSASRASALQSISYAERANATRELAIGLFHLAWAEVRLDNTEAARAIGERALAVLEQAADAATSARWSGLLGVIHDMLGDVEQALRFQHEALSYYRSVGHLTEVTTQLNNLGTTLCMYGDFAGAIVLLSEAQSICQAIGSRVSEIFVLSNLCIAQNGCGDYKAADATARQGIKLSELSRVPIFCDFYRTVSAACLQQGRVTEAVEAAHQALDVARAHEGPREVGAAWRALGEAIGAMSDSQGAPRCFEESVRLFTASGAGAELGRTLRSWAAYELGRGDEAKGQQLWGAARAIFAEHGLAHELARTPLEAPG